MIHPLHQRASDLGVIIVVESWIIDSWSTRMRFRVVESPFDYAVAGARLTPAVQRGEEMDEFDALPLVCVRALGAGLFEMLFGPIPAESTHATLVVTRLQVDEGGRIDVRMPADYDPFDPYDVLSDAKTVAPFHAREDDENTLAPEWECRGSWKFKLRVPTPEPSSRRGLSEVVTVGPCAVSLAWIDDAAEGTLLALDVVPPALAFWGALWKQAAVRETDVAVPRLRVRVDDWDGTTHGPYNTLRTRMYLEQSPPSSGSRHRLRIDELHGVRCVTPPEHGFAARTFESNASFDISLAAFGLDGSLRFSIHDVYGDDACFILMYNTSLRSSDVAAAWFAEAWLIDGWDVEHVCQEDGQQPLRDIGAEVPAGVRAMRFGAINPDRDLTLRITAFDLQLAKPVELEIS